MSEHVPVERAIGSLDARVTMIEARMSQRDAQIDKRLDRMETALNEVHDAVLSARGAWRAIAWMAGISGTVAAGLYTLLHWFMPRP